MSNEPSSLGTHRLCIAPPPWDSDCSVRGCPRPASPRRTWERKDDPVCNFHYVFDRVVGSDLFAFIPMAVGVLAGLRIAPLGWLPWGFAEALLIMYGVMMAIVFVEAALLLLLDLTVKLTAGGHIGA